MINSEYIWFLHIKIICGFSHHFENPSLEYRESLDRSHLQICYVFFPFFFFLSVLWCSVSGHSTTEGPQHWWTPHFPTTVWSAIWGWMTQSSVFPVISIPSLWGCLGHVLCTKARVCVYLNCFRWERLGQVSWRMSCDFRLSHVPAGVKWAYPVWVLWCLVRDELCVKAFPQSLHSYGFSPVWILRCWVRWVLCLNDFPQSWHS